MIFDKAVGESRKRPDVLIRLETHSIVIECDENQHRSYGCESKRTMQIFQDLGNKPLVLIRFNPDNYTDSSGKKRTGCFKTTKTVGYKINEKEWSSRTNELIIQINHFLKCAPKKEVREIRMFYSE